MRFFGAFHLEETCYYGSFSLSSSLGRRDTTLIVSRRVSYGMPIAMSIYRAGTFAACVDPLQCSVHS